MSGSNYIATLKAIDRPNRLLAFRAPVCRHLVVPPSNCKFVYGNCENCLKLGTEKMYKLYFEGNKEPPYYKEMKIIDPETGEKID